MRGWPKGIGVPDARAEAVGPLGAGQDGQAGRNFKKRDESARPKAEHDAFTALPDSVIAKPLKKLPTASGRAQLS